ncbi:MAG: hypothetical protein ACI4BI_01040 [Anaerotardibacter sp.]
MKFPWGYLGTENIFSCILMWIKIPLDFIPLMFFWSGQTLLEPEEFLAQVAPNRKAKELKKVAKKYKKKTTYANLCPTLVAQKGGSHQVQQESRTFNPFIDDEELEFSEEPISPFTTLKQFFFPKPKPHENSYKQAKTLGKEASERYIREVHNLELNLAFSNSSLTNSSENTQNKKLSQTELFALAVCFLLIICGMWCGILVHVLAF